MHIKINKNYLSYEKYKVKCALGKRGIGTKKKEGDKITPIGRYNIKFLLYRKDRIKKWSMLSTDFSFFSKKFLNLFKSFLYDSSVFWDRFFSSQSESIKVSMSSFDSDCTN